MSQMLLQIDIAMLDDAIADLSAKISDLSEGSSTARRHFERIIGSDATPDLSTADRISRLKSVLTELKEVLAFVQPDQASSADQGPSPPLSGHACEVLTAYAGEAEPVRLAIAHVRVGQNIPSARLLQVASYARGAMAQVLHALYDPSLPEPRVTFDGFFMACEEAHIAAGITPPESLAICDAAICYLDLIAENLEDAWRDGIEVPHCLNDQIIKPLLEAFENIQMH